MNIINEKLYEEIKEYCKLNGLKIGSYINSILRKAFNEDRFGSEPYFLSNRKDFKDEEKKEEFIEEKKEETKTVKKRRLN